MQRFELSSNDAVTLLTCSLLIPLPCAYSAWARWWQSCSSQDGPSFLITLTWWRLPNCSPILLWVRLLFVQVFTYPWSPYGWQASSKWSLLDAHLELALHLTEHVHYYKTFTIISHVLNYLGFTSFLIMMMSWRYTLWLTPSFSSRHTCHGLKSY